MEADSSFSVSMFQEVEPDTAKAPSATDERLAETTSSTDTSAAGSWTTIGKFHCDFLITFIGRK